MDNPSSPRDDRDIEKLIKDRDLYKKLFELAIRTEQYNDRLFRQLDEDHGSVLEDLEKEKHQRKITAHELQREIRNHQATAAFFKKQLDKEEDADEKLKEARKRVEDLSGELEDVKKELRNMTKSARNKIERLDAQLAELRTENRRLVEKNRELIGESDQLAEKDKVLREKNKELLQQNEDLASDRDAAQKELRNMTQAYALNLRQVTAERDNSLQNSEELKRKSEERRAQHANLMQKFERMAFERDDYKQKNEVLLQTNEQFAKGNAEMREFLRERFPGRLIRRDSRTAVRSAAPTASAPGPGVLELIRKARAQ